MTKKRNFTAFMIAIMIMLFSLPANAQGTKGYVQWFEPESDSEFGMLIFNGGDMPSGTSLYELNTGDNEPEWLNKDNYCTKVVFKESFKDVRPTSCYRWFKGFTHLAEIEGIENLNTDDVTNMSGMFQGCKVLNPLDVSKFKTDKVTDMSDMFSSCLNLGSLDVSNFNTAKVTNMRGVFENCSKLTSLNLSKFNTANVENMNSMFFGCSGLGSLDVSSFNTANVKYMMNMFSGCSNLTSLNLVNFKTDKVQYMNSMFSGCSKLTSLSLSNFNTDKVTDMSGMFKSCSGLNSLNLAKFNTDNVRDMSDMFYNCSGLSSLDVSKFNTAKVGNMSGMFYNCWGLSSLDVSKFNTANVWSMGGMFQNCSGLGSLDVSNFNTANVTTMSYMFNACKKLTTLDLSSFNTAKVTKMIYMFSGCSGLNTIYVSDDFTTASVKYGDYMFEYCTNLAGAVSYTNNSKKNHYMANYKTGYFKTYFTLGDSKVELCGESLTTNSLNLNLTGDNDFVAHAPFTANTATYSRDLSSSNSTWFSLCLPFAYTLDDFNFTAYQLNGATEKAVEIKEITGEIAAGTPVLFKFKDGEEKKIEISAQKAEIVKAPVVGATVNGTDGSSLQLCGTYQNKSFSEEDNNAFILLNDKLMNPAKMLENQKVTKVSVKPFRGYMTLTASAQQASARAFSIGRGGEGDEGTTAIDLLNSVATDDAEYYGINGRRIDAPAKGVNIVRRGNKTMKLIIK